MVPHRQKVMSLFFAITALSGLYTSGSFLPMDPTFTRRAMISYVASKRRMIGIPGHVGPAYLGLPKLGVWPTGDKTKIEPSPCKITLFFARIIPYRGSLTPAPSLLYFSRNGTRTAKRFYLGYASSGAGPCTPTRTRPRSLSLLRNDIERTCPSISR